MATMQSMSPWCVDAGFVHQLDGPPEHFLGERVRLRRRVEARDVALEEQLAACGVLERERDERAHVLLQCGTGVARELRARRAARGAAGCRRRTSRRTARASSRSTRRATAGASPPRGPGRAARPRRSRVRERASMRRRRSRRLWLLAAASPCRPSVGLRTRSRRTKTHRASRRHARGVSYSAGRAGGPRPAACSRSSDASVVYRDSCLSLIGSIPISDRQSSGDLPRHDCEQIASRSTEHVRRPHRQWVPTNDPEELPAPPPPHTDGPKITHVSGDGHRRSRQSGVRRRNWRSAGGPFRYRRAWAHRTGATERRPAISRGAHLTGCRRGRRSSTRMVVSVRRWTVSSR